jgi:hypothetical protein
MRIRILVVRLTLREGSEKKQDENKMNVEQLKYYGKTIPQIIDNMPMSMKAKVGKIIIGSIIKKVGLLKFIPFMTKVLEERNRLISTYPEANKTAIELAKEGAEQVVMMISIFNVIAKTEGRSNAYEFTKKIFQGYAKYTIPALYDVVNLCKCNGDCFANYKKYNIAMFSASDEFHVNKIEDEENCLIINVDKCFNVIIGKAFDCPEIAMLGCDHDLAGYPEIEDTVNSEFRRLHTIAKGDLFCDFMFFRKGFATIEKSNNK